MTRLFLMDANANYNFFSVKQKNLFYGPTLVACAQVDAGQCSQKKRRVTHASNDLLKIQKCRGHVI